MTIAEISRAVGVEPVLPDNLAAHVISGIATDSRAIVPGDLFVCLPGERVDGHNYVLEAAKHGAAAILAEAETEHVALPVWRVDNTLTALAKLASFWRERAKAKVVCITGTAGKTTLKDTLASILGTHGNVAATSGNHNNQLGLPLSILAATGAEDFWVIELGISHEGDMEYLGQIARPDLAIILNVGSGHTEGLGRQGVAWHKAQLLRYLAPEGRGLVNGCYADLVTQCQRLNAPVFFFGRDTDPFHVRANLGHGKYELDLRDQAAVFNTPFYGSYGWEIVLAAAAAASALGLSAEEIEAGFQKAHLPAGRFQQSNYRAFLVYDDTYNANPLSMRAMLDAAAEKAAETSRPLITILGAMGELGSIASDCHYDLGRKLAVLRPRAIFWKGPYEVEVRNGLASGGMDMSRFYPIASREQFLALFGGCVRDLDGAVIIFKGSRANRLEEYLETARAVLASPENADVL